ncbi:C6 finger domain transcription factor sirZ [Paramyrothecium foliicola]|nr:C6 finger domain transcription factor sirZ [Paramyrothecium foliicola]
MAKLGKPKGSRNKKTLARLGQSKGAATNSTDMNRAIGHKEIEKVDQKGLDSSSWSPQSTLPTQWLAYSPKHSSFKEETTVSIGRNNLRNTLNWDAGLLPSRSSDGTLSPLMDTLTQFKLSSPIEKDMPSTIGYYSSPSSSSSGTRIYGIESDDCNSEWPFQSHAMAQVAAALGEALDVPIQAAREGVPDATESLEAMFSASGPRHDSEHGKGSSSPFCRCLRMVTDQLCRISCIERGQKSLRIDVAFSQISRILDCSGTVLDCRFCYRDSKTLLLNMTLLQAIFKFASMSFEQGTFEQPVVSFGDWAVCKEESSFIRVMLGNRVLLKSSSTVSMLHCRVNEIADSAGKKSASYQVRDIEVLQTALNYLMQTFSDVTQLAKDCGYDY